MTPGAWARRTLVELLGRLLIGRENGGIDSGGGAPVSTHSPAPIDARSRAWIDAELALSGFRKTARSYLLRRMARAAMAQGDVTILAPALGDLFTIACAATDFGVGWEILARGTYEPHVVAFYRRRLRPGMSVADIGANIGFHALHAAALVGPSGRVIAIEPDPQSVALLKLSLALNERRLPVDIVEVVEAGLSDAGGELVHSDLGNAGNSGARFTHPERSRLEGLVHGVAPRFRTVPALRWDDRWLETPLDLVKIDIEGFEPRALLGMERSLARHRPIVLSEFAPSNLLRLGDVRPEAFLAWFRERGYACAVLDEDSAAEVPASEAEILQRVGRRGRHHLDLVFTPGRAGDGAGERGADTRRDAGDGHTPRRGADTRRDAEAADTRRAVAAGA